LRPPIAIIYNKPEIANYGALGDEKAVYGVLECVKSVYRAVTILGYPVSRLSLGPPLEKIPDKLKKLQGKLIFNLFEGFHGQPATEAAVATMIEECGLTYTGCSSRALMLALDKVKSKELLRESGIETPKFQLLTPETITNFYLSFPCIVKPAYEDASNGIIAESVVKNRQQLIEQVQRICAFYNGKAIVEEYIDGREFNITVLGNNDLEVLPISEIEFSLPEGVPNILTYDAKWVPESSYFLGTKVKCPAVIHSELKKYIEEVSMKAFRVLGCSGYARLDFRMEPGDYPKVIELNPNPDISPGTGAARQAKAAGLRYSQLIEKILFYASESVVV
jgi:D-alanine-D-alanine ligase